MLTYRILLLSALLVGTSASAQTIVDTSAAIGIQNSLVQQQGGTIQTLPNTLPADTLPASSVEAAPTNPEKIEVPALTPAQEQQLTEANSLLSAGKLAQARIAFERLITQNYNHPEAHIGLALTLLAQKDDKGAAFEFAQFRALAPQRFEGAYNLGVIATRTGNYEEALKNYAEAATLAKDKANPEVMAQILTALAGEQTRRADFAGLSSTLAELVKLQPHNSDARFRLAQAKALSGQGVNALSDLYTLLGQAPTRADVVSLIADIYVTQNLHDRATREIVKALEVIKDPAARSQLLLHKANISAVQGDHKAALYSAQAARIADKNNLDAWLREGNIWLGLGSPLDAMKSFRAAYALAPRDPRVLTELATLSLNLKNYNEASDYAQQLLKLQPDKTTFARAQFVQGVSLYSAGNYKGAYEALKASNGALQQVDTSLWLGLSAYALGHYSEAVSALGEVVRTNPTQIALQNFASALLADERYPEAEDAARRLVRQSPENAHGWYMLGLAHNLQNRKAEAQNALQTAVRLGHPRAAAALKAVGAQK